MKLREYFRFLLRSETTGIEQPIDFQFINCGLPVWNIFWGVVAFRKLLVFDHYHKGHKGNTKYHKAMIELAGCAAVEYFPFFSTNYQFLSTD
jgi:hypothetical protein